MSAADALVEHLPRTTLVVGKGGVGKTTCAAALALRISARHDALLLSTDPARALPSVLEQPVGSTPTAVAGSRRLSAQLLDADPLRKSFMDRWGGVIRTILDRGTYLDEADIGPLVDTALPGSDEIFSALALAELMLGQRSGLWDAAGGSADKGSAPSAYRRIIVDTAPTGHTLRLLNLPRTFRALVRLLDSMQEKHRFMVRTLTHAYRSDVADAFLAELDALVSALDDSLRDPARCVVVMVTNSQPLVLEETRRYLDALRALRVRVTAVVWNASEGALPALDTDADSYVVPKLDSWPVGKAGLQRWLGALRSAGGAVAKTKASVRKATGKSTRTARGTTAPTSNWLDLLVRPLTIVAGKGGVGKTTVASGIALRASDSHRTLIVSTDPAPSLADALAQRIPDADTPVEGGGPASLVARQMDASAAFGRLRDEYQSRVDALFDALVSRGVDVAHDRAIARDLLALAPPGVDEVYALSLISDALFKDQYERVIVDPAPTGHLLRLLEMPQLALAWTHQLMRLMLKYKEIGGLGETAQDLLEFSRSLRALEELLRDATRCAVVLVTLDEPVVRAETERLAREVRVRGVAITGLVMNRASGGAALPAVEAAVHFEAPAVSPAPAGPTALRRWTESWR